MYAQIIPLTKLPRGLNYFDYSVPPELETKIKTGHIVAIYFRKQKIYGIVAGLAQPQIAPEKIKPLVSLTEIILPKTLLQIAAWASENYLISPSLLYKLIIPPPVKKESASGLSPEKKSLSLNKLQAQNVIKILGNLAEGPEQSRGAADKHTFFLYENDFKEVLAIFIKIAQKELAQKKQVLLLAPSPEDINTLAPYFNSVFGGRLIIWQGKMAKGERFSKWLAILGSQPAIILGTRPACFLPFQNLSSILIYNCASPDLKQWDQNPRYDSRTVAKKLQEIHRTNLVFSDIFPDLKNFKDLREEKMTALNETDSSPAFTIVDIKKEKKSASFFSFPIYQMVEEGLVKKQKIILFINRKEKNSLLFCNDCRKTFSCPECGRPFVIDPVRSRTQTQLVANDVSDKTRASATSNGVDNNQLLCYHCNMQNPLPLSCPDCRGTNIKTLSLGADNIKKIINKEFPEAKIEIAAKNGTGASASNGVDILITTDYFWKNILPKMKGAAIYGAALLDFDFYLAKPEFNQKETALLALYRFLSFARNYNLKKALVQTAFPESDIFGKPEAIYDKELKEREEAGYPPFNKLIKIICKANDRNVLECESQELYRRLKDAGYHPLPPFEPYVKKRTKNYLKHIILKENLDKDLEQLKNIVPDEYQIDTDPISIY